MKYEFGDYEKSEIIEDYITVVGIEQIILVHYLSGNTEIIPNTLANEISIRKRMIEQAIERSKCDRAKELQNSIIMDIIGSSIDVSGIMMVQPKDLDTFSKVVATMFIGVFSVLLAGHAKRIHNSIEEIKDIEKYDIYLAIRELLTEYRDNQKLSDREKKLDIKNIDRYSLKEVKKLQKTLKKCDAFKESE